VWSDTAGEAEVVEAMFPDPADRLAVEHVTSKLARAWLDQMMLSERPRAEHSTQAGTPDDASMASKG
jgi:hypothetical protein